jgi:hypothetical protein
MLKKLVMVAVLVLPIAGFGNSLDIANGGRTTHDYPLTGALEGANGVVFVTTQLTDSPGIGPFNVTPSPASEKTYPTLAVPELGTSSLFGTGLICLVGISHKRNL